jgi:hypothetical protein
VVAVLVYGGVAGATVGGAATGGAAAGVVTRAGRCGSCWSTGTDRRPWRIDDRRCTDPRPCDGSARGGTVADRSPDRWPDLDPSRIQVTSPVNGSI